MNLDELFGGSSVPGLKIGRHELRLDHARIMAVLNLTPDSFSDGGRHVGLDAALAQAERLVGEGADILDVGGESTRPGAAPVSVDEEIARVVPVIEAIAARIDVPISIDTSKPAVMRAAVAAGAGLINDVNALRGEGALEAAAALNVSVCLMHMQGEPRTMQDAPHYDDVVGDVKRFLADRLLTCQMAGIDKKRIVIDPGFGFGKSLAHNLALLAQLGQFASIEAPLLVGLSRKQMIGTVTGRGVSDRAAGSAAASLLAVERGARIVRVHDVAATRDALAMYAAIRPFEKATKAPAAKPKSPWDDE
ncbi:MAG: dihydropteroate synthase [Rhodanobacteraceae bacterium]|nr:dihydropteroate synthase [Rhodanobacteraceae bacterium]MBL0041887.1 dihydropteroate synthase [Xanthomonadales bacterium]MBP6078351.1 dihydropteroate synthase [Xanthomonadales bacterium]MBP7624000.1 dihydropteroate synthase [Xanthomonadales bacterium]